ncbi:hypothetical protein HJFPF1_04494 [Paramyrothecium foliicola]|nr:hypothetical protein HJFPF1_04494 [Paramyrothecium foliicola]
MDIRPPRIWTSALLFGFHQTTFFILMLILIVLSSVMLAISVQQTREPICEPHADSLWEDDGIWALLSQMFLQFITTYCTSYTVARQRYEKMQINPILLQVTWWVSLISIVLSVATYRVSWQLSTIFSFISNFVGVIIAAQLAINLGGIEYRRVLETNGRV